MTNLANGFHHVGLITHSMQEFSARYERLGFSFTPLSLPRIPLSDDAPPEELGVGNRTAIFQHNYLEVLAVTDPVRWASISAAQRGPYDIDPPPPLAKYEGLHVMHFDADDLEDLKQRIDATSLASSAIRPFQRLVDTADGPRTMRAVALSFSAQETPEALIQIAQHLTPELVLQPRFQTHPNGATDIVAVTVCAPTPTAYGAKYAAMTGRPFTVDTVGATVDLGRARIVVRTPADLAEARPDVAIPAVPSLVEVVISVTDLQDTSDYLLANGVSIRRQHDTISVPAAEACGATITFSR